ncbi:MAG: hypothetical protein ACPL7D_01100 [Candidatus Sumerlaeaceae bacterium]
MPGLPSQNSIVGRGEVAKLAIGRASVSCLQVPARVPGPRVGSGRLWGAALVKFCLRRRPECPQCSNCAA